MRRHLQAQTNTPISTQLIYLAAIAMIPTACLRRALAQEPIYTTAPLAQITKLEAARTLLNDPKATIYKCQLQELSPKLALRNTRKQPNIPAQKDTQK